ncbi:MAG: hypothetical protein J7L99_06280 [Planctomycetes bacterium]|nr:hypothetical protein [Planctomycetota bacterium]
MMGKRVVLVVAVAIAGLMFSSLALAQSDDRTFRKGWGDDRQVIGQARQVRQWIIQHPRLAGRILMSIQRHRSAPAWRGRAQRRGDIRWGNIPRRRARFAKSPWMARMRGWRGRRLSLVPREGDRLRQYRRWRHRKFAATPKQVVRKVFERINRLNARIDALERRLSRLEKAIVRVVQRKRPSIRARLQARRHARTKHPSRHPAKVRARRPRKKGAVAKPPAERLQILAKRLKQREEELDRREAELNRLAKRLERLQRQLQSRRRHRRPREREEDED